MCRTYICRGKYSNAMCFLLKFIFFFDQSVYFVKSLFFWTTTKHQLFSSFILFLHDVLLVCLFSTSMNCRMGRLCVDIYFNVWTCFHFFMNVGLFFFNDWLYTLNKRTSWWQNNTQIFKCANNLLKEKLYKKNTCSKKDQSDRVCTNYALKTVIFRHKWW